MLEFFLVTVCLTANGDACNHTWDAYSYQNKEVHLIEDKFQTRYIDPFNRNYVDPSPDALKASGFAGYTWYKKQLKVKVYRGLNVNIQENNSLGHIYGIGYGITLP